MPKINKLYLVNCLLILFSFFFLATNVAAATVDSVYKDVYKLTTSKRVMVEKHISLINKTAKLYVSEYNFVFKSEYEIKGLEVLEDNLQAEFESRSNSKGLEISVFLKHPAVGRGAVKNLLIRYYLDDFLKGEGNFKELFIPVSGVAESENLLGYSIEVAAPLNFPKLGISKPAIKQVAENLYVWDDVRDFLRQNVYISFSDKAYYEVELHFALENRYPYSKKMSIPFVPDGVYQKVYVQDIYPAPHETAIDTDGNYLGIYRVSGNSVEKILFRGIVELSSTPRNEVREYQMNKVKKDGLGRYLSEETFWKLDEKTLADEKINNLSETKDIYKFVVDTLEYDTGRINKDLKRMGASWVLENPDKAVCMEYTDLFVALSREKGIASREVVGYALTANQNLLPLSFLGDVLHAWPEYYDQKREFWQPVDPTWGDTARVDYFSSLDLSHIAFVYHGKDTTFPLPPGVYKVREKQKDVYVKAVNVAPLEQRRVVVILPDKLELLAGQKNQINLFIKSQANIFLYDVEVGLKDGVDGNKARQKIAVLEPYAKRLLKIEFLSPKTNWQKKGLLKVLVNDKEIVSQEYIARTKIFYFLFVYKWVGIAFIFIILIFLLVRKWI